VSQREPESVYYGWIDDEGSYVVHVGLGRSTSLTRTVCGRRLPYWATAIGIVQSDPRLDQAQLPVARDDAALCGACVHEAIAREEKAT